MKKEVVYAPEGLGGIGYLSFACNQNQKRLSHFVCQLEWNRDVGKDIMVTLEQLQLQSGFVTPLMEAPNLHAPHI